MWSQAKRRIVLQRFAQPNLKSGLDGGEYWEGVEGSQGNHGSH